MMITNFGVVLAGILAIGAVVACSSSNDPTPAGTEADAAPTSDSAATPSVDSSTTPDAADAARADPVAAGCGTIDHGSADIERAGVIGGAPVLAGGAVPDGRYELAEWKEYRAAGSPPAAAKLRWVFVINAGHFVQLFVQGGGPGGEKEVASGDVALGPGNTVTVAQTCPTPKSSIGKVTYEGSPTGLVISEGSDQFRFVKK